MLHSLPLYRHQVLQEVPDVSVNLIIVSVGFLCVFLDIAEYLIELVCYDTVFHGGHDVKIAVHLIRIFCVTPVQDLLEA